MSMMVEKIKLRNSQFKCYINYNNYIVCDILHYRNPK